MKIKSLSLAMAFAVLATATAFAQDPTTSAPTPTHSPDQVKSAFSDSYTAFTKWDRQHGATMETITINGNDNVLKFSGDYVAVSVGGRNVADMTHLHMDVYSPASGGVSQVRPGFALFSGGEKYADAYNTDTPAGHWVSVDIPLSAFSGYDFSNAQVFRMTMTKTKGTTFYLDNVYFYKSGTTVDPNPVTPTPGTFAIKPAPVPTHAASAVKSIYCDVYTPVGTFINEGGNSGIAEEEIAISATDKARHLTAYNWVKYTIGSVDASDMTYLHFDVATSNGSDACSSIQPVLVNNNKSFYSLSPQLTKGKWTSIDVKLADFTAKGLDASAINEIRFKHSGTGTIVIDNVYFSTEAGATGTTDAGWGEGGETPVDPGLGIPLAPVPTREADDVKAFFSDAYPNLFGKFEVATYGEGKVEILDLDGGEQVCRITNLNWVPVNLGARDVSDKGYVHFDFYTPASDAVTSINVGFQNWNAADGSAYEIEGEDYNYRALTPGKWNSFDIPLTNFHDFDFASQMAVLRLRKGGSGKTLYVDNVYFFGKPGEEITNPEEPKYKPIQDNSDGVLPDINKPMLGVNLSSASGGGVPGTFGYDYMYPRVQDLYYFKAKGVRLVRLPFRAARFIEDIKNPVADYDKDNKSDVAAMKAIVAEAERLGMWVFLDAHDYAERTIDGTQYKLGEGEYTIERFAKMWGTIAAEFKDYDNIWGYDLQNEPKVTAQVLVEAYQAAIDEIRKVDTRAQIIVEGTNWASAYEWIYGDRSDKKYPEYSTEVAWSYKQNSPWLLAGLRDPQDKIVFQAHGYFDADNSGTYQKGFSQVDYRKRFLPFLEWCRTNGVKGLIGEFGVPYNEHATGDPRYMEMLEGALQLFREYGMNATYWCAGAMYESNSLTCQPDKNALYGNYAVEKSTMKVLEKYFTNWADQSGIENVTVSENIPADGRTYNLMGIEVDSSYVGFVVRDGKKFYQK